MAEWTEEEGEHAAEDEDEEGLEDEEREGEVEWVVALPYAVGGGLHRRHGRLGHRRIRHGGCARGGRQRLRRDSNARGGVVAGYLHDDHVGVCAHLYSARSAGPP